MARVQAAVILCMLVCSSCYAFAQNLPKETSVENELSLSGGKPRQLNLLLASLLLKKKIIRNALREFIDTALAYRAEILKARLEKLGLTHLLEDAGVEEPEEIIIESDLGNTCNIALDLGISCLELAKDEPEEVQVSLHKMYNVIYTYEIEEEKPEEYVVEYIPCEAEYSGGDVTYYVIKEDGEKTQYTPAYGDAPVEYIIKEEDGSTKPYTGEVKVVTSDFKPEEGEVEYEIINHSPRKSDPKIEVSVPKNVEISTPKKIAVETVIEGEKVEHVRYKPESKSGVYDTEALASFKMKLLEKVSEQKKFEEKDGIYVAKMLTR